MPADRPAIGAVVGGQGMSAQHMFRLTRDVEQLGMDSVWLPQMPNQLEVGTLLAGLAVRTERLRLGTAILPMYSRPPVVMAQTAATIDEMSGGRVNLGLGLGHRGIGDWMVGGRSVPALAGTREYLGVVTQLCHEGEVNVDGEWYGGHASLPPGRRDDLPVLLGAFGPRMLELAAEVADGVILWMCTPQYVTDVVLPALRRGWAKRGGRPDGFRVVAMMHAAVSDEPDRDRELFGRLLASYLRVATYRALFRNSGFADCVETGRADAGMVSALAAIGPEEAARGLAAFRRAGVDEVVIAPAGTAQRGYETCLQTLRATYGISASA
ncbi:LLM class flavin-dependent oxidoreductase [Micromonospora sp. NPDC049048]|uniref:LLM class flavin-dependent oxidoreductase n=1 Tax=Micromonospora sp. NPDC049048 TaxID=3364263 RepID=UPI00371FC799